MLTVERIVMKGVATKVILKPAVEKAA